MISRWISCPIILLSAYTSQWLPLVKKTWTWNMDTVTLDILDESWIAIQMLSLMTIWQNTSPPPRSFLIPLFTTHVERVLGFTSLILYCSSFQIPKCGSNRLQILSISFEFNVTLVIKQYALLSSEKICGLNGTYFEHTLPQVYTQVNRPWISFWS